MGPSGTPARATDDRELVLAFQAGERAAYDEMYRRYHGRVSAICSRILNNSQDAEEAAQETFLRAYQALPRFNGNFLLGAWLARIAANASVDQLRTKSRSPLVGLPSDHEDPGDDVDPEDVVVGEHPRLDIALAEIKPLHARALAWRNVDGLSHLEIAELLSMTPSQVKALLHRARVSLRKAWDRAEGWAIAPLFGIRSLWPERHGNSGSFWNAAPSLSPLLAEKVAATALVVAVALSGLPTNASDTSTPALTSPRLGIGATSHGSIASAEVRPSLTTSEVSAPNEPANGSDAVADLTEKIEEIKGTLNGREKLDEDPPRPEEPGGKDPSTEAASTARKVVKKVKDLLPHLSVDTSL